MSDMQIVKVVVRGELPKGCMNCNFSVSQYRFVAEYFLCSLIGNRKTECTFARPVWCPLVKQKDGEEESYSLKEIQEKFFPNKSLDDLFPRKSRHALPYDRGNSTDQKGR